MFPWMKEQLTEAWNNRKSSRSSKKHSLNGSSEDSGGMTSSSTAAESFLVNVISLDGGVLYVAVTMESTIEKVKSIATEHFYGHDKSKTPSQYRLVHGTLLKPLVDEKNLNEEEISESDELLLVEIRPPPEKENLTKDALKGPTDEEIINATSHLTVKNPPKPAIDSNCPADFQGEIRKILITLVQASAKILMYSPDAVKFYEFIREKLEAQLRPPTDPKAVRYLVEMGFPETKVLKALRLRKMNTSEALEWLLEHQDDPDEEEDLQLPDLDEILAKEAGPSTSGALQGARRSSFKESVVKLFKKNHGSTKKEPNLVHIVNVLLDSYRQYQKFDFKPSPSLVDSLVAMGFEREKVLEALKITGNNQANACAWLLGERRPSLQNLYEGMDPDGPIYNAIMSNPQIQLSLTNPKMLLAYLSMLETPLATNVWMKDPEVSPVLSQIFKTYHAEKHAIHVNRYDDSS